ncbi:unnamed protein product, partial [Mesorhabditis spiculigera]
MLARALLKRAHGTLKTAHRSTWVLQRVNLPEATPIGAVQRDPAELSITQRLEVVEQEPTTPTGNLQLILLEDVEGVGHQFDFVSVETNLARTELLPTRKAVYASPFDLKYYGDMKEKMKDELAARVRIPYDYLVVGRKLKKMVIPIKVSMENQWALNKTIVKTSLRQMGVALVDDAIYVPDQPSISGPNPELEAKLFRFYVVVGKQYIVPMVGRIAHVSTDETKKVITVEGVKEPTDAELSRHGLRAEECYFYKTPTVEGSFDVVDNSEFMRNGDYVPTRLQAQQDAVNYVINCKLRANPENAVGLLAMSGDVTVLSTMSQEGPRLYMKLHELAPKGDCKFISAIKVAHLALKHRQNRNHRMRIVLFYASPATHLEGQELLKVAKKLKKEKVSADVVCFGEVDEKNAAVFEEFVETINGKDGGNSHLLVIPGGNSLTEALANSAVCRGEDGAALPPGGAGFEFGDPEDDPDLALALRVSLEEQRARQAQDTAATGNNDSPPTEHAPPVPDVMEMDLGTMSEDQQLEWALRMSMQEGGQPDAAQDHAMDTTAPQGSNDGDDLMNNPELLQQLVNDLPSDASKPDNNKKEKKAEDGPSNCIQWQLKETFAVVRMFEMGLLPDALFSAVLDQLGVVGLLKLRNVNRYYRRAVSQRGLMPRKILRLKVFSRIRGLDDEIEAKETDLVEDGDDQKIMVAETNVWIEDIYGTVIYYPKYDIKQRIGVYGRWPRYVGEHSQLGLRAYKTRGMPIDRFLPFLLHIRSPMYLWISLTPGFEQGLTTEHKIPENSRPTPANFNFDQFILHQNDDDDDGRRMIEINSRLCFLPDENYKALADEFWNLIDEGLKKNVGLTMVELTDGQNETGMVKEWMSQRRPMYDGYKMRRYFQFGAFEKHLLGAYIYNGEAMQAPYGLISFCFFNTKSATRSPCRLPILVDSQHVHFE